MKKIKKINFLLVLVTMVTASSCVTERGAFKYYSKNPDLLAQLCAVKYPIENKLSPGKPEVETRTVFIPGVTLPCPDVIDPKTGEKKTPMVNCPEQKTIYINTKVTDTIYQENTAKLAATQAKFSKEMELLQGKLSVQQQLYNENKGDLNSAMKDLKAANARSLWHYLAHGLSLLGIGGVIILFFKK